MSVIKFKRNALASSVALVFASGVAHAQNSSVPAATLAEDSALEEVVVIGIRGSLKQSMDLKRDAQGIVDAISAEDMGKFPDTNLAESLQRITGVSIDREDGEGSKITVRGLGPDFNLVTLNGRQMPAAGMQATAASGTRSFDFANLASEGVAAVEVYKSSRAELPSGGLGATVNIQTPRPLENPGFHSSMGVKGVYDDSSDDASITPELSGIYSQTFADDKVGIAITGSYQNREAGATNAVVGTGWRTFPGTVRQADWSSVRTGDWGGIPLDDGNHINPPTENDVYSTPQQVGYSFQEFERTRTNGQVTLQFAPTDTFEATVDYTYSKNEIDTTYNDVGAWFNFGGQSTIFTDNGDGAIETPLVYSESMTNGDISMGTGLNSEVWENKSTGVNFKWQPTDRLTLELDYHSSSAEAGPKSGQGNSVGVAVASYTRDRTTAVFGGERPTLYLDTTNGLGGTDLLASDLQVAGSFFRASEMMHEIDQVQFRGAFDVTEEITLSFGAAQTDSVLESAYSVNQRDSWGGLGAAGDLPEEFFTLEDIYGSLDSSGNTLSDEDAAFVGQTNTVPWDQRFSFNFNDLRDFAAANYDDGNGRGQCADGSTWYCAIDPDVEADIEENTNAFYFQLSWDTTIGDRAFNLNAGVRYEETEIATPAQEEVFGPVTWQSNNELSMQSISTISVTDQDEYDYTLPSIDMSLEVVQDVYVRAAFSETIARPNWLDMRGGTVFSTLVRPTQADGSRGNPGLLPFESTNYDLSVEWYFDDLSYVSLGYFSKEVNNFIGSRVVEEQFDIAHPNFGPRADAARADGGCGQLDFECTRQYILDNFPDPQTAFQDGNQITIVGIEGEDGPATAVITEVANSDDQLTYDGIELAVQHVFDNGFGFQANYTMVDSDADFDNTLTFEGDTTVRAAQFAGVGASDTWNLVAFYETDRWQVRAAYNWRDGFLDATATDTGNNPVYVDEYSQIDLSGSFDVTDSFTVFAEVINLTDEYGRTYGRSSDQVLGVFEGGTRFNIGARHNF